MKTTITLLILLTVFSLSAFAQRFSHITLEGHTDIIDRTKFSPDGRTLATGSRDDTVRLWDVETGKPLHTFKGYESNIRSIAFSPDGRTLASSAGRTIISWDVETGKSLYKLTEHKGTVDFVAFGLGGHILASLSREKSVIRIRDTKTGKHLHTLDTLDTPVGNIVFSPDGSTLAGWGGTRYFGYGIQLWDAKTGKHLHTFRHRSSNVAFSPNSRTLAYSIVGSSNLYLRDVETGSLLHTLEGNKEGNEGGILSIAFSPDGRILASNRYRAINLWDVETGSLLHILEGQEAKSSIAFSPDGSTLIRSFFINRVGNFHYLWDVETGKLRRTLKDYPLGLLSPDRRTLVNRGRLWKLPDTYVGITPDSVVSPAIGEQFSVNVSIAAGEKIGGYEVTLLYDANALRYVSSVNGDYLAPGAFFVPPTVLRDIGSFGIIENSITLAGTSLAGVSNGDGTLATVTFEVVKVKESLIKPSNVILTDSTGELLPHWVNPPTKVVEPSLLPSSVVISLTPVSVVSPAIGEKIDFKVNITEGQSITEYQITLQYDRKALRPSYVNWNRYFNGYSSRNFYEKGGWTLHTISDSGAVNSAGTLATVEFEVTAVSASTVSMSGHLLAPNGLRYTPTFESAEVIQALLEDVNRDGLINILDLVLVASSFGERVSQSAGNPADVNEDGKVNVVDLVKVAAAISSGGAAPSVSNLNLGDTPTRAEVQQWITQAQGLNLTDTTSQRGIIFLEHLLETLTPKETKLLPNYPNPFNPETWMPYQLSKPGDVTLHIYAVDGTVVRTLSLGHQPVGIYQDKNRAAYWDGRNQIGEPVASGVYFYTLTAGEFIATRKMLIMK